MKRLILWMAGISQLLLTGQLTAQVTVYQIIADGRILNFEPQQAQNVKNPEPVRIPFNFQKVQIMVRSEDPHLNQPYRIRCKLEGFDPQWVDGYSQMRLVMRMLDKDNNLIAAMESSVDHDSSGWQGSVQNSTFTTNTLRTVVPDRTARVQLWCVSGGPEYTTGIFALQNLKLKLTGSNGEAPREIDYSPEAGTDLDEPLGSPTFWKRDGSRPQMAQIARIDHPQPHHALVLSDWDSKAFAAWLVPPWKCPQVHPGDTVTAEWEECHCVGQSGTAMFEYARVPPGNYWLRVAVIGMDNTTVLFEESLPIIVLAPVWSQPWFWLLCGFGVVVLAMLAARWLTKMRMNRELERLERQHLLDRERTRIARDIHDDLGTTLTQISFLSQSALENDLAPDAQAELRHIHSASLSAIQAMDEVVWAADPSNDSLDELATYLSGFAQNLLDTTGIRCRIEMPITIPNWDLSAEVRHNVFLAFKEALNNAIKHGQPTEVQILLRLEETSFVLSVSDNGKGYTGQKDTGHGLGNMQSRLETIGGRFCIETPPDGGTLVRFEVPVKK